MPVASIEHARAAGDHARAVALLEIHHWRLPTQGHSRTLLLKRVRSFPEGLRKGSPTLNTALVWRRILHGEYRQGQPLPVCSAHCGGGPTARCGRNP